MSNNSSGLRTRLGVMDIRVQAHGVADDDGISFFDFSGVGVMRQDGKQQAGEEPRYCRYEHGRRGGAEFGKSVPGYCAICCTHR